MNNNEIKAQALLKKYRERNCTEEEAAWVEQWYLGLNKDGEELPPELLAEDLQALEASLSGITRKQYYYKKYASIAAAAIVLLVSGIALFTYIHHQKREQQYAANTDIAPGGNKAILTLADGRKVNLTDVKVGMLSNTKGLKISKEADGQLVYEITSDAVPSPSMSFNKIETPRGGQYKVLLPDGTAVWLNAASSLKYPASFGQLKERRVMLFGEAYFEVAHNKQKPFVVEAGGQEIKVLGTHFNVNAYADEPQKRTTLLQGSVQVSNGGRILLLHPGEQSQFSSHSFTSGSADIQTATGWKNGRLAFSRTDIRQVLREIARWYDIEIEYSGAEPNYTISGEVPRQAKLSEILKILSLSEVHFKQQGRKLIIYP